jgi:hypothetical protein
MGIQISVFELAELTKLVVKSIRSERPGWQFEPGASTECINRLREVTGLGWRQAKNLVDVALPNDPVFEVAMKICYPPGRP